MAPSAMFNFRLPLPQDLHEMLREEVERSGQSATTLAREALLQWLVRSRKQHLHEEIAAFASAQAGTALDLDEALEQAGIEAILAERAR